MFNLDFIKKLKKKIFPFYKNKDLNFVFKKLNEDNLGKSKNAMFVGGCVRKFLLNEEIDDIDIATSVTTDRIKEKFRNTKFKVIDSGIKHGTVTLVSKKLKLELTTLRKDIITDGRHAEVEFTDDWQEDSNRRDFTINAIYLDIKGKIFDPQSGVADLKNCFIKFIGDPHKRIEEDYLRIIRFIRFCLEYKSEIDQSTLKAIRLNLNGIKKISKERILIELFKILNIKNFVNINNNKNLKEIFLLIFPEFKYLERLEKLNSTSNQFYFDKKVLLALLLVDETNNHEYFSHKYNVSNILKDNLNLLAKNYIQFNENKNFFVQDLKKNIFYFGKEHLRMLNTISFASSKKVNFKNYLNNYNNIEQINLPKIPFDGKYLKQRGIKEGENMGKILKLLENDWVNNGFQISDKRITKIIEDNNY